MEIKDVDPALKACMKRWKVKARGQTFRVAAFTAGMAKDVLNLAKRIKPEEVSEVREIG
jgi:hypothetical protein